MSINYAERKICGLRSIYLQPCLWGQLQQCCSVISSELNEHVKWKMLLLIMVFSLRACLQSTSQTLIKESLEKALPTHGSMCCVWFLGIRKSLQKKLFFPQEKSAQNRDYWSGLCSQDCAQMSCYTGMIQWKCTMNTRTLSNPLKNK